MDDLPDTYDDIVKIAVIGGTGLSDLPGFTKVACLKNITTPWGAPSSPILILHHTHTSTYKTVPVAFISRHGLSHEYAPHEVPYRANIAALRKLGVRSILAFSAVGSLKEEIRPRDFVAPTQVVDRTRGGGRPNTFFEGGVVCHVPFADPFDRGVGDVVRRCGHALEGEGVRLHDEGLLICMEGPQFSTRAESNLYRTWGGAIINMSCLPEAKLAREAEIAYQMICMATDYDCWRDNGESVSVEMVVKTMRDNAANAKKFVTAVLDEISREEYAGVVEARGLKGTARLGLSTVPSAIGREARERLEYLFPGEF